MKKKKLTAGTIRTKLKVKEEFNFTRSELEKMSESERHLVDLAKRVLKDNPDLFERWASIKSSGGRKGLRPNRTTTISPKVKSRKKRRK